MKETKIRLQKIIADAGLASRRKAEQLIIDGKVTVNGRKATLGDKADPKKDRIVVGGKKLNEIAVKGKYYIMLHKPRGFVTTMSDEMGRKCVAELIKDIPARLFPVGRLDRDSEGLLLMTNDGEFANGIAHPSCHLNKTYRVTVRPSLSDEQLEKLKESIVINGRKTIPAEVFVIERQEGRVVLQFVLQDGKNRQIRNICEQAGLEVARLKRVAIGQVKLGMLPQGKWRDLTADEIKKLTGKQTENKNRW